MLNSGVSVQRESRGRMMEMLSLRRTLGGRVPGNRIGDGSLGSGDLEETIGSEEDNIRSSTNQPIGRPQRKKPLNLLPLVAIIFYEVCGGPFGIEDSITYGGPLLTIVGLIIFPLVWSVPEALISAEFSTMFPENSGTVAWVTAAFGPCLGYVSGFASWVSGVLDNSIYPLYLTKCIEFFLPGLHNRLASRLFLTVASMGLIYWNYIGLAIVGRTAVVLTVIVLLPFVIMTLCAIPHIQPSHWLEFSHDKFKGHVMEYLNIMFWNLNYWDSVASLAGEVENPGKTFPKAFGWAFVLVVLTYFIPVLTSVGVMGSEVVGEGYFVHVAQKIGGPVMAAFVMIAAAASQIGQFEAEMSSDAFMIQGMSDRGILPRFMGITSRFGTPTIGILMSSFGVLLMVMSFSFEEVIEMLNYAFCISVAIEFAAFLYLRIKAPNASRPYRVPVSTAGAFLMVTPAFLLIGALLVVPWVNKNFMLIAFNVLLMFGACASYLLLKLLRTKWPSAFNQLDEVSTMDPQQATHLQDVGGEDVPLVM